MSKFDFSVIEKAGLTQAEFAELSDVSRVSVNNWINGRSHPALKKVPRIKGLLKALALANKQGMLPSTMPSVHKANMDERRVFIRKTLRTIVKSRKA